MRSGNLLTLPVANGLIYVQPYYVQARSDTAYPLLQRVAVAYTDVAASVSEAAMVEQAVEENGMEFAGNIAIPASGVRTPWTSWPRGSCPTGTPSRERTSLRTCR